METLLEKRKNLTLLQRKKIGDRILSKVNEFVETFINGIAG